MGPTLLQDGVRLTLTIILTKKHLEMDYMAASHYMREGRAFSRDAEQLSKLTLIDCLGADFATSQHIWL
jgi:hypothetical protein